MSLRRPSWNNYSRGGLPCFTIKLPVLQAGSFDPWNGRKVLIIAKIFAIAFRQTCFVFATIFRNVLDFLKIVTVIFNVRILEVVIFCSLADGCTFWIGVHDICALGAVSPQMILSADALDYYIILIEEISTQCFTIIFRQ